ncbi:hypothetical protein [Rhodococcus sp. NCIMB 12038]|uniref:hypothetical protein n=1 Tax=Rhodococcus sp. NCIMB 12038 TaxID=933800 RepID=UPI00117A554C|nr:hypothetical protein [Rhodococcus sp. NCIMB 12038]
MGGDTMAGVLYKGITCTVSQTRFDATRELLLQKLVDGKAARGGDVAEPRRAWHHLFAAITLIE